MKMMTKALEKRFKQIGSQRDSNNPILIAKYFNPRGESEWYATEYCPKKKLFWGYAAIYGDCYDEWSYFSLSKLKRINGLFRTGAKRDLHFKEKRARRILYRDQN